MSTTPPDTATTGDPPADAPPPDPFRCPACGGPPRWTQVMVTGPPTDAGGRRVQPVTFKAICAGCGGVHSGTFDRDVKPAAAPPRW